MSFPLRDNWVDHRNESWSALDREFDETYTRNLDRFLGLRPVPVYPPQEHVFRAFCLPLESVRVVILGQDPYFKEGQATGLAFAVRRETPEPKSLESIFDVLTNNGYVRPSGTDLTGWEAEGVLLMNRVLTVDEGAPDSHRKGGWWSRFTRKALLLIARRESPAIFCLWGAKADNARPFLLQEGVPANHLLTASHPSRPHLSLGGHSAFAKCDHFRKIDRLLAPERINWSRSQAARK